MPFKVWCEGCGSLIATGVRFNAEKKQIGNYFSTKVSRLTFNFCGVSVWFALSVGPSLEGGFCQRPPAGNKKMFAESSLIKRSKLLLRCCRLCRSGHLSYYQLF
jgi:hypothetical protein